MKKTTVKTYKQYQITKKPGFIQPWFSLITPFFQTLYTRSFKVVSITKQRKIRYAFCLPIPKIGVV